MDAGVLWLVLVLGVVAVAGQRIMAARRRADARARLHRFVTPRTVGDEEVGPGTAPPPPGAPARYTNATAAPNAAAAAATHAAATTAPAGTSSRGLAAQAPPAAPMPPGHTPITGGPLAPRRPRTDSPRPGAFGTLPLPPAQRRLTTRDHTQDDQGFPIEPPGDLPTFADVGGMESFKADVEDSVGLLIRHPQAAARYGITWNGLLLHGPPGVGKTFLGRAIAGQFGMSLLHLSTGDLVEGVAGASARNVQRAFAAAAAHRPCLLLFDEFDSIAQRRDGGLQPEERRTVNQLLTSLEQHRAHRDVVVVATTNDISHLDPAVIRPGRFDRHVRVDRPDAAAREAILEQQLRGRPACDAADLGELARRTEGLTPAALSQLVDAAALRAFREAADDGALVRITQAHLLEALTAHGGRDRPTVEGWDWDSLVLPEDVKAELQQVQALVEDPELAAAFGVSPPSGVLLAGPPGTGKTTVARVLAAQARCSFYPVSAADVLSKWVGDSERRIAELFERARANRPAIVFIDEIDALGARREAVGQEGAARLLNQLLQEIDGIAGAQGVLVMGATNRAELLDPALVRGGRMSRTITLPLPDRGERLAMLQQMTARMPTVDVDLPALAAAGDGLSGADLKALCQQAALHALVRARQSSTGEAEPAVLHGDFERALADRGTAETTHARGG